MTSADVKKIRGQLKLSQDRFGAFLGVDTRTVQRWENGDNVPTASALAILLSCESALNKLKPRAKAKFLNDLDEHLRVGSFAYYMTSLIERVYGG